MNRNDNERLQGAMQCIRLIENELATNHRSENEIEQDRELDLIDDLLTLQMGIGPLRRKQAMGIDKKSESNGEEP